MKKIFFFLILSLIFSKSFSWNYPLREISKPTYNCKFTSWDKLGANCKMPLPPLTPSMYDKYLNDSKTYRRVYSILWASSYKYGWDVGNGSHLGVDIATSLGTPVRAIGKGRVVFVGYKKGRGKVVVIQHKVNGKYIYSNYAHLSKIFVKFNDKVNENTKIGLVGHSGNSYGNHLHFQIDTNQAISKHPFRFGACSYKRSVFEITNNTFCLEDLKKNTLDPLAFIASKGAIVQEIKKTKKAPIIKKIERKKIKVSYEDIQQQILRNFLANYKFKFYFPNKGVYTVGKYGYFTINLKGKFNKTYNDVLPEDLNIEYDKTFFRSFSPRGIKILKEKRKVTFLPKKSGVTFITVKLGKKVIYTKMIRILKKGEYIKPKSGIVYVSPRHPYIGAYNFVLSVFKDKNYINLINTPFPGYYYISSDQNFKFCKLNPNKIKTRNYECKKFSDNLAFSYKDTISGVGLFKFYSRSGKPGYVYIKDKFGKLIAKSRKVYFKNIKIKNRKTPYLLDIKRACRKGFCLGLTRGSYLLNTEKLSKYDLKNLIENVLNYKGKYKVFKKSKSDKKVYISRLLFVKYLLKYAGIKVKNYKNYKLKYFDTRKLSSKDKNYIIYLDKLGFKWKDRFAKYHFQPDKPISIEEALYITDFLIK